MQNEKINIDFIQISPRHLPAPSKQRQPTMETFLKGHETQFRIPEQCRSSLAFLGQIMRRLQVSDADG
jgi:hypothetical protein